MKSALLWFLVLAFAAAIAWLAFFPHDPLPAAWQAMRFRDPEITQAEARERLAENERVRALRLSSGTNADVSGETHDEVNVWEEQFHLGDADRAERLALQQLTKTDMRQRILESLKDEAFLESRIHPITEKAARDWYDAHTQELCIPMLHRVSHIFLSRHVSKKPDRSAEMRDIQRELQKGTAFAMLAARRSEDPRSKAHGGDLGWISAARMPDDFMTQVEKLRVGETSGPVTTKLGWHLLIVTGRRPSRIPVFEEVKDEIMALLDFEQRSQVKP